MYTSIIFEKRQNMTVLRLFYVIQPQLSLILLVEVHCKNGTNKIYFMPHEIAYRSCQFQTQAKGCKPTKKITILLQNVQNEKCSIFSY